MIKHKGVIILIMSLYISTYNFKKDFACITVFCSEKLCRRQGGVVLSEKVEGYVQGLTLLNDSVSLYSPLWQH